MKRLFLAMLAFMLVTSTAYAFESTISGSYFVNGDNWMWDIDGVDSDEADYDHDLDLKFKLNTDENTSLTIVMEARDQLMVAGVGGVSDDNGDTYIRQIWISHKFGTGTTLEAGDMGAPLYWGTDFTQYGDDSGFALAVTQDFSFGSIRFVTEQTASTSNKFLEDDTNWYQLGATINIGDMSIMPAVHYGITDNTTADVDDNKIMIAEFAFTGAWGKLSAEAEAAYVMTDKATPLPGWSFGASAEDYAVFGVYAKVGYDLGMFNVAGIFAYGSVDDDQGFDYGDLYPVTVFGDSAGDGGYGDYMDLIGITTVAVKFGMNVNDKLSLNATAAYLMSNFDTDDQAFGDMTAIEVDFGVAYKITDALTYSISTAYAAVSELADGVDADVILLRNTLRLAF